MDKITNEIEVVKMAKEGNQNAFATLFRSYSLLVRKIARRYFLIGAEIEDLVQEGMIGLASAINTFDETKNASFKTFATLCVKRSILSAVKKNSNKKNKWYADCLSIDPQGAIISDFLCDNGDDDLILVLPSNSQLPDDRLIWQEKLAEIKLFIENNLSDYEKKILEEFLKGGSYEQISKTVGKPSTSVENALSRIRSKLSPLKNI